MLIDQHTLRRRLASLRKKQDVSTDQLASLEDKLLTYIKRREQRLQALPNTSFNQSLPVTERKAEIAQAIKNNQVIILSGETG